MPWTFSVDKTKRERESKLQLNHVLNVMLGVRAEARGAATAEEAEEEWSSVTAGTSDEGEPWGSVLHSRPGGRLWPWGSRQAHEGNSDQRWRENVTVVISDDCRGFFLFFLFFGGGGGGGGGLRSPAISLGFTTFGWDFCVCDRFFFNPTIEVVTFRLCGWCMLGMFLLPAFTRLGHERQDLLSPCDEMHVCTD